MPQEHRGAAGRGGSVLLAFWIAGTLALAPPMATPAAAQTLIDPQSGGTAGAVDRLVGGIISYVRWPGIGRGTGLATCTVGQPALTSALGPKVPGNQPPLTNWRATAASIIGGQPCDVIYLGQMPVADRRRLIDWVRYRPVLTITDVDPDCLLGAAFCLTRQGDGIRFAMNIDAVTRSKLAVDPRVLQLARPDRGGA